MNMSEIKVMDGGVAERKLCQEEKAIWFAENYRECQRSYNA